MVNSCLNELLSSGPEEEMNFAKDAAENGLVIVRLVSILIFTVHNVNRETEGQTYAEILQRTVLLQNAFTAIFEFMGHILKRCGQFSDPPSSYLLPGILVFVEWLACCPDVAAGNDADEKQATVRLVFWNHCISFLNKLLLNGLVSMEDDEDETCFSNMSRYEEGETENRLALLEDFELRGFLPLLPAQTILDFSRKHSYGSGGNKEKKARVKRILAAGKALVNVVKIDQKTVCFDSKIKKFVIGVEPQVSDDLAFSSYLGVPTSNGVTLEFLTDKTMNLGIMQPKVPSLEGGDEEDEVIVFKPTMNEKRSEIIGLTQTPHQGLEPDQNASARELQFYGGSVSAPLNNLHQLTSLDASLQTPHQGLEPDLNASARELQFYGGSVSAPLNNLHQLTALDASSQPLVSVANVVPQHLQPMQPRTSNWLVEEAASLANGLRSLSFLENGHQMKLGIQEDAIVSYPASLPLPIQQYANLDARGMFYGRTKTPESIVPSKIGPIASTGFNADSLIVKTSDLPASSRKSPVSRPARHLGPPPGFSSVPSKQVNEPTSGSDSMTENPLMDDYSWLDEYQLPPSLKGKGLNSSINYPPNASAQIVGNSNTVTGTITFPFPGKQIPTQIQMEKQNAWQDHQPREHLKLYHEQQLQQSQQQQQLLKEYQQFTPLPDQYQGESVWPGRYFV